MGGQRCLRLLTWVDVYLFSYDWASVSQMARGLIGLLLPHGMMYKEGEVSLLRSDMSVKLDPTFKRIECEGHPALQAVEVSELTVLGKTIAARVSCPVEKQLGKLESAFWASATFLLAPEVPLRKRFNAYYTRMTPVGSFDSACWTFNARNAQRINAAETEHLCRRVRMSYDRSTDSGEQRRRHVHIARGLYHCLGFSSLLRRSLSHFFNVVAGGAHHWASAYHLTFLAGTEWPDRDGWQDHIEDTLTGRRRLLGLSPVLLTASCLLEHENHYLLHLWLTLAYLDRRNRSRWKRHRRGRPQPRWDSILLSSLGSHWRARCCEKQLRILEDDFLRSAFKSFRLRFWDALAARDEKPLERPAKKKGVVLDMPVVLVWHASTLPLEIRWGNKSVNA